MPKSFLPAVATAVALAIGGMAVTTVPVTAHAGQAGPTVSADLAPTLKKANDAATAKRWPEAIAAAQEALANSKKTPYDTLVSYQILAVAYNTTNNQAELLKALQGQVDTGQLSASQQNDVLKAMAGLYYRQRNYDQTIAVGQRLISANAADASIYTVVGQSYYQKNQFAEAARFLNGLVTDQEGRGQKPAEQVLQLVRASYNKVDNKDGENKALERLVVHYPKAEYWDALLYGLRNDPKLNERQTMQVYRLMEATKTLKRPGDYSDFADMSLNSGMYGEARRVLESGLAANVFTQATDKGRADRLLASATRQGESDRANLSKMEAEARTSAGGDVDVALGFSLLGYGENAKAAESLSRGLTKGQLRNPAEAQTVLGIAYLRAGNKAEAQKAFRAVKGDELDGRIASLWALHAK